MLYFFPLYLLYLVNSQTLTRSVAVEEMGTLLPQIRYQSTMCAFLVLSHRLLQPSSVFFFHTYGVAAVACISHFLGPLRPRRSININPVFLKNWIHKACIRVT